MLLLHLNAAGSLPHFLPVVSFGRQELKEGRFTDSGWVGFNSHRVNKYILTNLNEPKRCIRFDSNPTTTKWRDRTSLRIHINIHTEVLTQLYLGYNDVVRPRTSGARVGMVLPFGTIKYTLLVLNRRENTERGRNEDHLMNGWTSRAWFNFIVIVRAKNGAFQADADRAGDIGTQFDVERIPRRSCEAVPAFPRSNGSYRPY
ncbi:hypothetical protein B0H16DRAFT_1470645 [Mycena metata]|uniref:Uncharacterized protein n=1 Tax=Mycena metata TaxID=1033252 RepID=A0AAD7HTL2_9AGAR|nr:hypothetical protein B0H16DRAFT_1470645 [Mycena metata]